MIILAVRRRNKVRVVGEGRFFCLRCETEAAYELREWSTVLWLAFVRTLQRSGRFVLCIKCRRAFELEVLDETSTADHLELEAVVPEFVYAECGPFTDEPDQPLMSGYSRSRRH